MKKLDGMNKKEQSGSAKNKVKNYVPQNLNNPENSEEENTSLDASLEAAIEELKETTPQSGSGDGDDDTTTVSGTKSKQHSPYTPAQIEAIEEEVQSTKESILSTDNQGNEGILPNIILPSKLKELYEKEAFILNQKK